MTAIGLTESPAVASRRTLRPVPLAVGVVAAAGLVFLTQHLIGLGFIRPDVESLRQGEATLQGDWMSKALLTAVRLVPSAAIQNQILALLASLLAGVAAGAVAIRLQRSFSRIGGLLVLAGAACNAEILYGVTGDSRVMPLLLALAVLLPVIRNLELVGDTQAAITTGLGLPVLLLAGPATSILVLPLAIATALRDSDGRRDARAFTALLLVCILPTVIVVVGMASLALRIGSAPDVLIRPYRMALALSSPDRPEVYLLALASVAPLALVPLLHLVRPLPGTPRGVASALIVIGFPIFLALGGSCFPAWNITVWAAPAALLVGFVTWLCLTPLPFWLRVVALVALAASTLGSWQEVQLWADPGWVGLLPF